MENSYLEIYKDKSILKNGDKETIFIEGKQSKETKQRTEKIKKKLDEGYFEKIVKESRDYKNTDFIDMDEQLKVSLDYMINSITSNSGRAVVGLTILQCCLKSIDKEQSIRLHKGNQTDSDFSWKDGIAMRPLDKKYFTPILRKYKLLNLNADGLFLTRTLAENYPYTTLYKAIVRGAKEEWLNLVELLEAEPEHSIIVLKYLLFKLNDNLKNVESAEKRLLEKFNAKFNENKMPKLESCINIIKTHFTESQYSSKIFELAIHSFFQVAEELQLLGEFYLKPLSQMKSANKKNKNIGDIEIVDEDNVKFINEAWDCKYGKSYLYNELCELEEKLHEETRIAGFICNEKVEIKTEIEEKIKDIQFRFTETEIKLYTFEEFINYKITNYNIKGEKIREFSYKWLKAYIYSLANKNINKVIIDEPNLVWMTELIDILDRYDDTTIDES